MAFRDVMTRPHPNAPHAALLIVQVMFGLVHGEPDLDMLQMCLLKGMKGCITTSRTEHSTHMPSIVQTVLEFAVSTKSALEDIPEFTFAAIRIWIAVPALWIIALSLEPSGSPMTLWDWIVHAYFGLVGVCGPQALLLVGVRLAGPDIVSIMQPTIPVWVALIMGLFGLERLTAQKSAGIVCSVMGAAVMLHTTHTDLNDARSSGIMVMLVQLLCYSTFLVSISEYLKRRPSPLRVFALSSTFGTVPLTALGLYFGDNFDWTAVRPSSWAILVYCAIGASCIAHALVSWAIQHVSPTIPSLYTCLQPIAVTAMARIVYGDVLHMNDYVGMFLIFVGLFITVRSVQQQMKCGGKPSSDEHEALTMNQAQRGDANDDDYELISLVSISTAEKDDSIISCNELHK